MDPAAAKKVEHTPATVWALGLVSLFTDIGGEMIFPILPRFLAALPGLGPTAVGLVEGVADGIAQIGKPIAGARSDRMRRRKPYVLFGYGLSGLSRPLLGLTGSVGAATAVRASDRLGKGIRSAPRDALIAGSVDHDRQARAFAVQQAMDHAGAVIGPLLAAALLGVGLSIPQVFVASAVPGLLAFLTILFFVREAPAARTPVAVAAPAPASAPARPDPIPRQLQSYFVILFLFALGSSTDAMLLLHAGNSGLSPAQVTWLWSGFNAVKAVSNIPGGALADRSGPVRSILAGWVVYGLVYAGFAAAHTPGAIVALFGAYGLYFGFAEGAEKVIVSRMVSPGNRGRAFGVMGFVNGVGTFIASFATGWLYKSVGPGWAFGTGAAAALLAALAFAVWARVVTGPVPPRAD
ncbi:MAG TPA: MFS transporter [bacterium]|nr:MFS transporter [bacterium]